MWKRSILVALPWLLLLIATSGNFFFWDTVQLASKQAHFFYENNFQYFFLPADINSGHPPFYGIVLALSWKVFSYSLFTGHFLNALFIIGSIYQAHLMGQHFLGDKMAFYFPLVLFCNPIFLGHSILVSPDNALVFLLLLALNALFKKRRWIFVLATVLLALLSMRGMMCVLALFLGNFFWSLHKKEDNPLKAIIYYFPAGVAAASFFLSHYLYNEWIGFHNDSPWQESFNLVGTKDYIKNVILIAWRVIDFGNIFILLGILFIYFRNSRLNLRKVAFVPYLLALILVFVLPLAGFKYLSAHRYFMPIHLLLSFAFAYLVVKEGRHRLGAILLILLFLGNWWIYPRSISQGWDVSLGHLPFYELIDDMDRYLLESGIDLSEVGSEFPIKSEAKVLYMDDQKVAFKEAKVGEFKYIIYSRVINDYKEEDYEKLQIDYRLLKEFNKGFIDLKIYERSSQTEARRAE